MQMIGFHVPTTDGRELILTRTTQPEPELLDSGRVASRSASRFRSVGAKTLGVELFGASRQLWRRHRLIGMQAIPFLHRRQNSPLAKVALHH